MSERDNYRDWAKSVRSEARRQILALRAERADRRRPAGHASDPGARPLSVSQRTTEFIRSSEPCPKSPPLDASPWPEAQERPLSATATQSDVVEPDLVPSPPETPANADIASAEPLPEDILPEAAVAPDPPDVQDTPPPAQTDPETRDSAPEASASVKGTDHFDWDEESLRSSDLFRLPGIGIGLVWLLHANHVTSLAELADADPARLSDGLGLVGRLIDVPAWIDLARRQTRES